MTTPTLSIITPTLGRDSLERLLAGLIPDLSPDDEVIVIGDGPRPRAREIVASFATPIFHYWEIPLIMNFGNPQRNEAIRVSRGTHIHFLDDDDLSIPGSVQAIKAAAAEFPGRPMMFRMHHGDTILWRSPAIEVGNVSGQMFVAPNVKDRLGAWSGRYEADYDFITSTLALYPDGAESVVWKDRLVAVQGLAGKKGAGGIERA